MDEVSWAAGFFEGEGCITLGTSHGRKFPRLALNGADEDAVRRFAAAIGARVNGPYTPSRTALGSKPQWHVRVSRREEVERVLRAFWPGLSDRRQARAKELLGASFPD